MNELHDKAFVRQLMEQWCPKEEKKLRKLYENEAVNAPKSMVEEVPMGMSPNDSGCKNKMCGLYMKCSGCKYFIEGMCEKFGATKRGKHTKCFECRYMSDNKCLKDGN